MFRTVCFDENFLSYEIEDDDCAQATNMCKSDELLDAGMFQFTNCDGKMFITSRYGMMDVIEDHLRNMGQ